MEKKLLLLGLLLSHDMHGYQLNEVWQQNPGSSISLKKSNAYRLLADMEEAGWISHSQEQEGNRPQRRVYAVTEAGEAAFFELLRENLATYPPPELPGVVGLDFLHLLSPAEAAALLVKRLQAIDAKFQQLDEIAVEIRQAHLAAEYMHTFYAQEIAWLTKIIDRLHAA